MFSKYFLLETPAISPTYAIRRHMACRMDRHCPLNAQFYLADLEVKKLVVSQFVTYYYITLISYCMSLNISVGIPFST